MRVRSHATASVNGTNHAMSTHGCCAPEDVVALDGLDHEQRTGDEHVERGRLVTRQPGAQRVHVGAPEG